MEQTTSPVLTSHLVAAMPPVPRLYWVFSPTRGILDEPPFRLAVGAIGLGRTAAALPQLVLPDDPGISRRHVTLRVAAGSHLLTLLDESSQNSTWVNGQRVPRGEELRLSHGDVLRVGDSVLVVCAAADPPSDPAVPGLLGRSPRIAELRHDLSRLSRARLPVLLLGEPGTGKERTAQGLHALSGRKQLCAIDCGALAPTLFESTLFGHLKGAFTDAKQSRPGLLREAHEGTLFLDEVGNLSEPTQQKLLRALAERHACPVGAEESPGYSFDVLLVAATNRELDQPAAGGVGSFRADLLRRLQGAVLRIPPLRERREDILYLLQHMPTAPGAKAEAELPALNTSQVELLLLHAWPGNVGDLLNVREHLRTLGFNENLRQRLSARTFAAPPPPSAPPAAGPARKARKTAKPDRAQLLALLKKHGGKLLPIEKETGWSRRTLRGLVREYDLEPLRKDAESDD